MPVLSRRTRRLLKLLIVPNWGSRFEKVVLIAIPLIVTAMVLGLGFYWAYAEDGKYKSFAWFPLVYLWVHQSFKTMEKDNEKTRNAVRDLRRDFASVRRKLESGKVKVDVENFAIRAQNWSNKQAASRRRT